MVDGARLFPGHGLPDELDSRTFDKLDTYGVQLAEALFHLVSRGDALERITGNLDAHLDALRASQRDPSDSTWRRFHGMNEDQVRAFLDLLVRATSDAVLQLRAVRDYENAIDASRYDQVAALEAELVERIANARAEGAEEARRAIEETPAPATVAPRSRRAPVVRLAPKSKREVRRAS